MTTTAASRTVESALTGRGSGIEPAEDFAFLSPERRLDLVAALLLEILSNGS
jgi:hypothetical protein